jgi:preprotein translocase SecE subunit
MFNSLKKSIKSFLGEYKQVQWPSLQTTINLTLFVLLVSVIITLMILGLDTFLFELRSMFIFS